MNASGGDSIFSKNVFLNLVIGNRRIYTPTKSIAKNKYHMKIKQGFDKPS